MPKTLSPYATWRTRGSGPQPVPAENQDACAWSRWLPTPGRRALLQRPVRAMLVVVIGVLAQDQPQVPFTGDQHPVQALMAAPAIQRSAIAFARGCGVP